MDARDVDDADPHERRVDVGALRFRFGAAIAKSASSGRAFDRFGTEPLGGAILLRAFVATSARCSHGAAPSGDGPFTVNATVDGAAGRSA